MIADLESDMFIDPSWQESLISLLIAINGSIGAPDRASVLKPLTNSDVVAIAQDLSQHNYKPDRWFGIGGTPLSQRRPVASFEPQVQPGMTYTLLRLGAEPSGREMLSGRSGGLLYEDPFYAVLAAYNIGKAPKRKSLIDGLPVEVKVAGRDLVWSRRQGIVESISNGLYREDRYFTVSGPFIESSPEAMWRLGGMPGVDLFKLADNGLGSAAFGGDRPQSFVLYKYIPPER